MCAQQIDTPTSLGLWMRQRRRMLDITQEALASAAPDGHELTILPFVTGERSPDWAGNARATFHGLTLATTPVDILRATPGLDVVDWASVVHDDPRHLAADGLHPTEPGYATLAEFLTEAAVEAANR